MTNKEIVQWVIDSFEGRLYTDDPVDTGGATKFGITLRTLRYYRRKKTGDPNLVVTKEDVKIMTIDEAVRVGEEVFLIEPRIAEIENWRTKLMVYDYGFHSGQPRAVSALQSAYALSDIDGKLGPITLAKVNDPSQDDHAELRATLTVLTDREEFMHRIMENSGTQRKWMLGWWKRTTKLQRLVLR